MDYWLWILAQIVPISFLVYFFYQRKFSYWTARGVKGPKPTIIFGNIWDYIRVGQVKLEKEFLVKYGKIFGLYYGVLPVLSIADVDLIKQVLIKDFPNFVNRDLTKFDHDIWSSNLFNSDDEQWRRIRAITSPSFTTGKLKGMHLLMNHCIDKLAEHFRNVIKTKDGKFNAKEVITGFTIDVIASTSFATETNANEPEREKNAFLHNGVKLLEINPLRFASFFLLPKWFNKLIGSQLGFRDLYFNFFVKLSREIVKQRKLEKVGPKQKRGDLVQLLMDAFVYEDELQEKNYDKLTATAGDEHDEVVQNGVSNGASNGASNGTSNGTSNGAANGSIKRSLTENEIIAQCILFFIAGFETTANTISNCLYHLAVYPEVQNRLREEVEAALEGLDENSDEYLEKVNTQIPYLEAVMKETLRKCPPVPRLQRRVGVDNFKLAGVPLEKDTTVEIATFAVHHCADYYPDPEKFDPERWMPENKKNLIPYTYLPFGAGPRNCIGMRFAYQEIKLCLAKMVRQFKYSTTPETKIPMEYTKFLILSTRNLPLKVELC